MIEAVVITRELAEPIIVRSFSKKFDSVRTSLLSQFLEALRGLAEEEMGDQLREIVLLDRVIYVRKGSWFTISIVTDGTESIEILEDMFDHISNLLENYDPDTVVLDDNLKKQISREIGSYILMERVGINMIKEIAEETKTLVSLIKTPESSGIKLREIVPKVLEPKPSRFRFLRGKTTFDRLIEYLEKGALEDIIKFAPDLFDDPKYSDYARALFVKAGIFLISRPIDFPAPKPDILLGVTLDIKDNVLRDLLIEWLKVRWDIEAPYRLRMYYIEKREKILERMKDKNAELVYLFVLLGIPDIRLIARTISLFHKRSSFISAMALAKQLFLQIATTIPDSINGWLKLYTIVQKKYEEYKNKKGAEFLITPYIFSLMWALNAPDMSENDLEMILGFVEKNSKMLEKTIFGDNPLSTCQRAAIIYFGYYIPTILRYYIYDIPKEELEKLLSHMEDCIRRATTNFKHYRIQNAMLYMLVISSFLGLYTRVSYYLSNIPLNIVDLIAEVTEPSMTKTLFVNRFHAIYYLVSILDSIGYILFMLPKSKMRDNLIKRVCDVYALLFDKIKTIPIVLAWVLSSYSLFINALEEEDKKPCIEILNSYMKDLSPFLKDFIKKASKGE